MNIFKKSIIGKKKKRKLLFCIYDPLRVKLLVHVRLHLSHLNEHEFRYGFGATINLMCACGTDVETTEHFFLTYHFYSAQRFEFFENLEKLDPN